MTEFASAADHTQTRQKWLEMGVPILKTRQSSARSESQPPQSVFDEHLDNTDPDALTRAQQRRNIADPAKEKERWKYTSPHIGGMAPGEFQQWLDKTLKPKKILEWRMYLEQYMLEQRLVAAGRQARAEGRAFSADEIRKLREELKPSGKELRQEEKRLRDLHLQDNLSSELSQLLTDFFDLPVLPDTGYNPAQTSAMSGYVQSVRDIAPPTTHPSAGLSHLRTNAVMENHPIYGPQKHRAPVEARVVDPRDRNEVQRNQTARFGVGGFVAADPQTSTFHGRGANEPLPDRMARQLDESLVGGNKIWVHPEYAHVDDMGKVVLTVGRAHEEATAVKRDDKDAIKAIFEKKRAGTIGSWSGGSINRTAPAPWRAQPLAGPEATEARRMFERANPLPKGL